MEKKRRARINQSLNDLKRLLLESNSVKKEVSSQHLAVFVFPSLLPLPEHAFRLAPPPPLKVEPFVRTGACVHKCGTRPWPLPRYHLFFFKN